MIPGPRATWTVLAASTLALMPGWSSACAQEYPDRAIHAIVGFPPGSGADIIARYFSKKLTELAGKPVVVENKPGATSNIALGLVARAKPDGYTFLYAANSNMAGSRFFFKDMPFNTVKDFVPVALLSQTTFLLIVSLTSPAKTVGELSALVKANPRAKYGYTNQTSQLATEAFKSQMGITAVPVSYRTATDVLPDLTNGTLDFNIIDGTFGLGQIRAGRIRPLAVTTAQRLASLPDVPTMQEAGLPGFDFASWWAAWLPKGAAPEIVAKLGGWFNRITADPETRTYFEQTAGTPLQGDTVATAAKLQAELVKWERVTKSAGIVPQ